MVDGAHGGVDRVVRDVVVEHEAVLEAVQIPDVPVEEDIVPVQVLL